MLQQFEPMLVGRGIRILGALGPISLLAIIEPRWGVPLAALVLVGAAFTIESSVKRAEAAAATRDRLPGWSSTRDVKDSPVLPAWAKLYLTSLSWSHESEDLQVSHLFQPGLFTRGERSFTVRDSGASIGVRERLEVLALLALLVTPAVAGLTLMWGLGGWRPLSMLWWVWLSIIAISYWCEFLLSARMTDAASRLCADFDLIELCPGAVLRIIYLPQPKRGWIRGGAIGLPGLRRIYISAIDYQNLSGPELRALVAHEAAHLRGRHDLLVGNGPLLAMSLLASVALLGHWLLTAFGLPQLSVPGWLSDPPRLLMLPVLAVPILYIGLRDFIGQRWLEPYAYREAARAVGNEPVLKLLAKTPQPRRFWGLLSLPDVVAELSAKKPRQ